MNDPKLYRPYYGKMVERPDGVWVSLEDWQSSKENET